MEEIEAQGQPPEGEKQQIRIDESQADVSYANFFLVSTGIEEFVFSFGVRSGDSNTVKLKDRVIVSPRNFKRIASAVGQALHLYEERFGAIDISVPGEAPEKAQ